MATNKEILAGLAHSILPLQGFRPAKNDVANGSGLGIINTHFPNGVFPLGAVHEFISECPEDTACSLGFIAGILSSIVKDKRRAAWLTRNGNIFPPALAHFNLRPEHILFVHLRKEKEAVAALEEIVKSPGLAAVVGEISELSFMASRRLQLAIEQTGVTCFLLRTQPRNLTTASVSRWRIKALPGRHADGLPGVGIPGWKVELLKVRNGKPGSWEMEWRRGAFRHRLQPAVFLPVSHLKTG